jgi:preprotein translocase subunit SecA
MSQVSNITRKYVKKINSYADEMKNLSDEELQAKTPYFKEQIKQGKKLEQILPEAFAVVREASDRVLGMRPYDVQMIGGVVLHQGKIAEMKTGEGKANPINTPIPTPKGWKVVGDIKVGDYLFDRLGKPTKVIGVYPQGMIGVYKVTLADGREIECAGEHLWSIYEGNALLTFTTQELMKRHGKLYIPLCSAVEYDEQELPYPSYQLGSLVSSISKTKSNYDFKIENDEMTRTILKERRIPSIYKVSSIEQRWDLVKGMLEASGNINFIKENEALTFSTYSEDLKDDFMEVVYSLGLSCSCGKDENEQYIVSIFTNDVDKFKALADKEASSKEDISKIEIVSIEYLNRMEEQVCFEVDNDEHLFLVGQYVVTHNTLVTVAPAYLNALSGKSVHVVTVNDYLANRDMETLKPLYEFLGLSVDCIIHDTPSADRRDIYAKDVIYITNSELGFDYLRDNMVKNINNKVQCKPFSFCIIDEADSILIDEARTPLIISSPSGSANDLYTICDVFVKHLKPDDYEIDKQLKLITLSEIGVTKAEKFFGLKNYSDIENTLLRHHLEQSLRANLDMKKDKEYIVKDGQVILIDEHTGRIAEGRRFSNGLHQALEAKEGVYVKEESITMASITYQNFFKQYEKFSGMTGTAKTEEKEFKETYGLKVVVIPTNKPCIRNDKHDIIFVTEKAKNKAIIEDIKENYKIGRPVLVGTLDIAKSEELSNLLKQEGIPHHLLNAKQIEWEAKIVADAGQKGAVTIATNMAGRGTDIKLTDETRKLGGLKIIASERASNRRIDNQLKGRSGRQGDPGESQFYLSFQDELITYITSDKLKKIENLDQSDELPVSNKLFSNIISNCQKKLESQHFETRKNTTKYDKILNNQRIDIYEQRDYVLTHDCTPLIDNMVEVVLTREYNEISNEDFVKYFVKEFHMKENEITGKSFEEILAYGKSLFEKYKEKLENANTPVPSPSTIILTVVDNYWIKHLVDMNELKQDIKLMSYRGEDPVRLYAKEGFQLFENMNYNIKKDIVKNIFNFVD